MPHPRDQFADRAALERHQSGRLTALLAAVLPANRFYTDKFAAAGLSPSDIRGVADLARLPFTTKDELLADQEVYPPYGARLSFPRDQYTRLHQTSGTSTGRPLRCLDTAASWQGLLDTWASSFALVELSPADRLFFPFSFGPFLGFWAPFEAGARHGCLCLPGGGMSSAARLRFLLGNEATVVFVTPTYALRLAEVAAEEGIDLPGSSVRMLIVAGEPGGCIPATRARLEAVWGARVIDHYGMSELGPVALECPADPGSLTVIEGDYVIEVIDPASGAPVQSGEVGELVVTGLGRWGHPLLRYRTGDLVKPAPPRADGPIYRRLEGGILGRRDDMIQVRGNNLYPTALEGLLRRFEDLAEYRIDIDRTGPLTELRLTVEPAAHADGPDLALRVQRALRDELLFRVEVAVAAPGQLPRFEMKAKRVHHRGTENTEKTGGRA